MVKSHYDTTLAPASAYQSARLVQRLARQGYCDGDTLHISPSNIVDMNPNLTLTVFGGSRASLRVRLKALLGVPNASSRQDLNAELTCCTLSPMVLERKLSSARGALDTLSSRISGLQHQLGHFDLQSGTLMNAMATVYVDVISPSGPRIQVADSPTVLQSPWIQAKAHATLLAGIRVAVPWHQVGSGRLQLMFSCSHLTTQAKQILAYLIPEL